MIYDSGEVEATGDANYLHERRQLNPKAPEFVPISLPQIITSSQPPPIFFNYLPVSPPSHPPPQPPPFVMWYTCFLSPRPSKPALYHANTANLSNQMLVAGGCSQPKQESGRGSARRPHRCRTRRRRPMWVEKAAEAEAEVVNNPLPVSYYPFRDSTSLMIRHIPVRLSRGELLELLDEHCRQENEKISGTSNEPPSEFDFLYLPIDFKRKGNLGYAFVNFTTWEGAARLFKSWTGSKWENLPYNTLKICNICRAKFQGKEELKKHFERSVFHCETDEYLPVEIRPARNGRNAGDTNQIHIGSRVTFGSTKGN